MGKVEGIGAKEEGEGDEDWERDGGMGEKIDS